MSTEVLSIGSTSEVGVRVPGDYLAAVPPVIQQAVLILQWQMTNQMPFDWQVPQEALRLPMVEDEVERKA
jgi:hypothetical protein